MKTSNGGESKAKHLTRFGWYELPEDNSVVRFCQDSGLHGLKYVTGPKQHLCERMFWLVAFFIATVAGSVLIYNTWDQYKNLPVIFVQSQKQLSIADIPFPSVTVCELNRVKKVIYDKYYELSKEENDGENTTVQEAKEFVKILDTICDPSNIFLKSILWKSHKMFGMGIQSAFLNLELSQSFQNESNIMKLLKVNSQNCLDLMPLITFKFEFDYGIYLVEKVETDFGICCTFNTIPISKLKPWRNITGVDWEDKAFYEGDLWLNETVTADTLIFTDKTKHRAYPLRQNVPGISLGLSFTLKTKLNESHCNNSDLNGFLVSIVNPLDAPSTKDKENFIELNTEVYYTLKPKITEADESIKRFTPEKRGCYFGSEWKLRDHSVYTKSNCLQECIANLTMEYCQPVADCWEQFTSMYGMKTNWIYGHVCEPRKNCSTECLIKPFSSGSEDACKHCLPTCNDIKYEYNLEVKHLKDDYIKKMEQWPMFEKSRDGNKSIVHVYFDEYYATPIIRKEQFGILELLANSGGLLGLCLGFSGISILEIIYYFTIRVCFRHFRRKALLKNNGICQDNTFNHNDVVDEISSQHIKKAETTITKESMSHLLTRISKLEQVAELSGHHYKQ